MSTYTCKKLSDYLVGKRAKAHHPISCINPEETFIIKEVEIETRDNEALISIRGENTCWFNNSFDILD